MILDRLGDVGVAVVAGKGGVGSSTVAAALSLAAARNGADVLFISVDGKPGIGPLLGGRELDENEHILRKIRWCSVPLRTMHNCSQEVIQSQ